ncbi:Ribosomal silencing factor RsfS [Phycisphaerae bacterium RAS1]|nr:Ribosomal silencing factor RsfS [Phycisphaerae bacterium RAS1]
MTGALQSDADNEAGVRFAQEAARIASDSKAEDVVVLDLRGISPLADLFVIGTGTSARQMHATLENIREFAKSQNRRPFRVSGGSDTSWILADYVDVVIHLFDARHRSYYDLDGLWGDAPQIEWRRPEDPDGA